MYYLSNISKYVNCKPFNFFIANKITICSLHFSILWRYFLFSSMNTIVINQLKISIKPLGINNAGKCRKLRKTASLVITKHVTWFSQFLKSFSVMCYMSKNIFFLALLNIRVGKLFGIQGVFHRIVDNTK